jgi:putative RNA 2'-phosphotransferase
MTCIAIDADGALLMNNNKELTSLSKLLSLVLRHQPEHIGLQLDAQGWVATEELLRCLAVSGRPTSLAQLQHVVDTSDKRRFAFSDDGLRIRANQGHSVEVELGLIPQQPPERLFHGTATRFLASILETGLTKQSRHHVHLSANEQTAGAVGRRYGQLVLLVVDTQAMAAAGHTFFKTDNDVWLTDSVPPQYIQVQA